MRKTKEFTLAHGDGTTVTYTLLQCGAIEGSKAVTRIFKILAGGATSGEDGVSLSPEGIFRALKEEDMDFFCQLMAKHTMLGGERLTNTFDEHFAGKPMELFKWLFAA